ncbi:hypothetical protein NLU13_3848 [Sarocladium strictum]|uniref:Uncharacterized protein n=1 Tax=Sarocladium strictum TaxID=5046 RepID=A0AA39L836_SARSR|nr:hypothetical protein NLU13_3848 [Sarocladium strictum]
MRFTAVFIASALSAVAVAQSTSASPTYSLDPAQASIVACLDKCGEKDIDCKARCNPVPNPSETQVIQLDKCVGDCPKGDGSDAGSAKYAECRASCISEYYYNTSEGTPRATGAAGGSNGGSNDAKTTGTDSASGAASTGASDKSGTKSESTSGTGTGAASSSKTSEPNAASQLVGSGAAIFGLMAAVFAL